MVRQMAAAMRVNGLKVGDRVAGECILDLSYLQMHEILIDDTSNCNEQCYGYRYCSSHGECRRFILQYSDRHGITGRLLCLLY